MSRGKIDQNNRTQDQSGDNSGVSVTVNLAMIAAASLLQKKKKSHERFALCQNCGAVRGVTAPCPSCSDPVF